MDKYSEDLVKSITAHPSSVRLLHKKYGVNKPATLVDILNVYQVAGEPFLHDLFDVVHEKKEAFLGFGKDKDDKTTNTVGPPTMEQAMATANNKKTGWDKFKNWFNDASTALTGVATAVNQVTAATNVINQSAVNPKLPTAADTDKQSDSGKQGEMWLYIAGGGIILLIILIIFLKK